MPTYLECREQTHRYFPFSAERMLAPCPFVHYRMALPSEQRPTPLPAFSCLEEGATLLFGQFSFCFVCGQPGFQGLAQERFLCTE